MVEYKIYRWYTEGKAIDAFEFCADNTSWLASISDSVNCGHTSETLLEIDRLGKWASQTFAKRVKKGELQQSSWLELLLVLGLSKEQIYDLLPQLDNDGKVALLSKNIGKVTVYDLGSD